MVANGSDIDRLRPKEGYGLISIVMLSCFILKFPLIYD